VRSSSPHHKRVPVPLQIFPKLPIQRGNWIWLYVFVVPGAWPGRVSSFFVSPGRHGISHWCFFSFFWGTDSLRVFLAQVFQLPRGFELFEQGDEIGSFRLLSAFPLFPPVAALRKTQGHRPFSAPMILVSSFRQGLPPPQPLPRARPKHLSGHYSRGAFLRLKYQEVAQRECR